MCPSEQRSLRSGPEGASEVHGQRPSRCTRGPCHHHCCSCLAPSPRNAAALPALPPTALSEQPRQDPSGPRRVTTSTNSLLRVSKSYAGYPPGPAVAMGSWHREARRGCQKFVGAHRAENPPPAAVRRRVRRTMDMERKELLCCARGVSDAGRPPLLERHDLGGGNSNAQVAHVAGHVREVSLDH